MSAAVEVIARQLAWDAEGRSNARLFDPPPTTPEEFWPRLAPFGQLWWTDEAQRIADALMRAGMLR